MLIQLMFEYLLIEHHFYCNKFLPDIMHLILLALADRYQDWMLRSLLLIRRMNRAVKSAMTVVELTVVE